MTSVELVEMTEDLRNAFRQGPRQLGVVLGLSVPNGWPEYPEILQSPAIPGWPFFLFTDAARTAILGSGGYLCAPDSKREVQLGYEVAPAYRGRGVATCAMKKVLAAKRSATIVALTHSNQGASAAVLRKLGFSSVGSHALPGGQNLCMWARLSATANQAGDE